VTTTLPIRQVDAVADAAPLPRVGLIRLA